MWIVELALRAPVHGGGHVDPHPGHGRPVAHADGGRHLSRHRHSRGGGGVGLSRPAGGGHGAARRAHQRARLLDDGQRHRAHRVAVDPRRRALLKVYFQPGTDIGAAIAQISSVSSTILRIAPPGMTPPNVIQFNASNVPVAQLTASSETLPEEKIFDYGLNFVRVRLFTIPGLSTPAPFGGKQPPDQRRHRSAGGGGQGAVARRRGERAATPPTSSCRRARRASATANTTWS